MKKKLFVGLGLAMLLFIMGALMVLRHLETIIVNQGIASEQNVIISIYNEMLYFMRSAQAELYRHQAGYSRNIDDLVTYIESFENNRHILSSQYQNHFGDVTCMQCHPRIEQRLLSVNNIFSDIDELLEEYKRDVSVLITTRDPLQRQIREQMATQNGQIITSALETAHHAAHEMWLEVHSNSNRIIERSRHAILLSIAFTLLFCASIFLVVIRGITRPVQNLIGGIQTISRGDFSQRVEVKTRDEIGIMAEAFNTMAERLDRIHREKDSLLQELQELNENLEHRVEQATAALRETQAQMVRAETLAAVGTLAAGVSHEVSTPLNAITGFCRIMLEEVDESHPLYEDLKVVEQEALRCRRIVQSLLQFARVPSHSTSLACVNELLDETMTLVSYQTATKGITIDRDFSSDLPDVSADPMQLKQVLLNIVLNAIQAMEGRGRLHIRTFTLRDTVMIAITDSGPGIPAEQQQKIFQPFYTTKSGGTGLGLAISYGIIKEYGGDILLESAPGKGTTVTITLPAYQTNEQEHKDDTDPDC
ncbi:ATP-binding region ATPase domain protein [Desulfurispirillum indicum S5]|uniref:histidine kinase n=1 Tax=Desulfurispirillum indicum (strain ATCC BAA-1389 / DSM 22839 / S5) TaxID=653733 RepID=E6W4Q4_DESIS|nr:HAMP domain-containing sensor histidine kinase [Desulfurispirillum indicum]ADU64782.1 ATP-binding region ATPase domain protein [Desulfurispirillum indicum S5]